MDFTDEQIMQYVDGDASPELASNISNARVKDKELEAVSNTLQSISPVFEIGKIVNGNKEVIIE